MSIIECTDACTGKFTAGMCGTHYQRQRRASKGMPTPGTRRGTEWQVDALCAGDLEFTERDIPEQLAVCHKCPVRELCIEQGISQASPRHGVAYGARTPRALATEKRRRRRAV